MTSSVPDAMGQSADTRAGGLTLAEVEESRRRHGRNVLTPVERDPWWKLFLSKFDDPVIRILMVAGVIAIAVGLADGHYAEGIGILVAILLATVVAFANEYKASKEFEILNKMNDEVAVQVLREGKYGNVPRSEVVVGDHVVIEAGQEVPADGYVVQAVSLQIDQARLTGESEPVRKVARGTLSMATEQTAAYSADRLLRGTIIRDGHGAFVVTAVGDATDIGQTLAQAVEATDEVTPLNRQLLGLSKVIGVVGFGMAFLTYVALVVRGFVVGELVLTQGQLLFAGGLVIAAMIALIRVWLPVFYDAFELVGKEVPQPQWLENESLGGWIRTLLLGAVAFAVLTATLVWLKFIPASPSGWLTAQVGSELLKYFMIAVTIIVVAVPEGLAMSVTLSLAYSMRKMTATNNLVRRMHACETIGAATVICSDKTGTLTRNEMTVFEATSPLMSPADPIHPLIAEGIAANSTANLNRTEVQPVPLGNPTEGALLLWLDSRGIDYTTIRDDFSVDYQWTFSTERKFMGTIGRSGVTNKQILHVKGAPEILLDRCSSIATLSGLTSMREQREAIETALRAYQTRGMRTLAFAYRDHDGSEGERFEELPLEELSSGMVWLGFVAVSDPIRAEVPSAIASCRRAGVGIKIVTGDNPATAQEIARQLNLWNNDRNAEEQHLSGSAFANMTDEEAKLAAQDLVILSRARPKDKLRLVTLLQEQGHVVAVTGDGMNDAPALNHADVGLAMGKSGTAIAKEASDIILLDDSFKSVVNAIMWGRSLYENIQRFILFQLTINVAALVVALLGPFIGIKLPLTVTQMLWVNLIMDTFAAVALATEPPHLSVLNRPPRDAAAFIVTKKMATNIFAVAGVFLIVMIGYLLYIQGDGKVTEYELSYFFTGFVLLQFWNLLNARCLGRNESAFMGITQNVGFVAIVAAIFFGQILMVQFGGSVFRTVPLTFADWVILISVTSLVLWIGELSRCLKRAGKASMEPLALSS